MENQKQQAALWGTALILTGVLVLGIDGCKTAVPVDDPTLTSQVQQRLAADSAINREPVQVMAQAGVVTLTGAVSNNAARSLAANDAAGVTGVQKVINDLVVNAATPPVSATVTTPLPQVQPLQVPAPRKQITPRSESVAPVTRTSSTQQPVYPQQAYRPPVVQNVPQAPTVRVVTLPAGSTLPVRITQTLDSATTQPGDTFSGALAADILVDGMVALPRGTAVNGRVAEVHEAAHFKGSSLLSIELIGVSTRGERIALSTQPYSVEGKGRGKNTAVKTGIGAAAGAVLGGIFGGGKGAAIGAAAGGGTGVAINGVTRGDQVQIPSESIVRFVTADSIAVRTSERAGAAQGDPGLQTRP